MRKTLKERFDEKWAEDPDTGCWNWTGAVSKQGYGQLANNDSSKLAHRISYELYKGKIYEGAHVCHTCDNTSCVNPDHLELGSKKDSVINMCKKGRHHAQILNDNDVISIYKDKRIYTEIAKDYNIDRSHISAIKLGKRWSWLTKDLPKNDKQPKTNLSEQQIIEIFLSDKSLGTLSKEYNIGTTTVSNIKRKKTHKEITDAYGDICPHKTREQKTIKEKFEEKFVINEKTNCWEWTANIGTNGYGRFKYKKRMMAASRASYQIYCEEINDPTVYVCHTCDNPLCVNPDHLFLGTAKDNTTDMINKGRKPTKLITEQVVEIFYDNRKLSEIEKEYNISRDIIWRIKTKKAWKHVTDKL